LAAYSSSHDVHFLNNCVVWRNCFTDSIRCRTCNYNQKPVLANSIAFISLRPTSCLSHVCPYLANIGNGMHECALLQRAVDCLYIILHVRRLGSYSVVGWLFASLPYKSYNQQFAYSLVKSSLRYHRNAKCFVDYCSCRCSLLW